MTANKRYTVLGFGEKYMVEAERRGRPPGNAPVGRPIDDARRLLTPRVANVVRAANLLNDNQRISEVVVELRMDEKFLAKSYAPKELLAATGLSLRGTGTWMQDALPRRSKRSVDGGLESKKSKTLFVSGSFVALGKLEAAVKRGVSAGADNDIAKIEDIRLPDSSDRFRIESRETLAEQAVELILYNWPPLLRRQAIEHLRDLFRRHKIESTNFRIKEYSAGPTFIAGVLPYPALSELAEYNFLRSARLLPRVRFTKAITRQAVSLSSATVSPALPAAHIAIFDGGFGANPLLDPFVRSIDLTAKAPSVDEVEHGTMVASAAVYGPFDLTGAVPAPQCQVSLFRVLPDPVNDFLELYGAIDAIEDQVPKLPVSIRVINLSFGPRAPIDDIPSRFTYAIDRLSRDYAKLFITAVGNDGEDLGGSRVQAPSDAVNNIGVGAFRYSSSGAAEYARYSCHGPGRSGGFCKPDFLAFGGCEARPFFALVPGNNALGDPYGTSFAAPMVASIAGRLGALVDPVELQPEALRALLVHSTRRLGNSSKMQVGRGRIPSSVEEVLACSERRVSVLYQGEVSPRESWKLPFLLPPGFEAGGKLKFEWTIAYTPEVEPSSPDEYALAGLEIAFRPHADIYRFSPPLGQTGKPVVLNVVTEAIKCEALESDGWKRGILPVADSKSSGKSEEQLRAVEGKWETLLTDRDRGKLARSVSEPLLTISVHGRGDWDQKDSSLVARFAAVLTIEAPKYNGDLYAEVLRSWDLLKPLHLRTQATPRLRT